MRVVPICIYLCWLRQLRFYQIRNQFRISQARRMRADLGYRAASQRAGAIVACNEWRNDGQRGPEKLRNIAELPRTSAQMAETAQVSRYAVTSQLDTGRNNAGLLWINLNYLAFGLHWCCLIDCEN